MQPALSAGEHAWIVNQLKEGKRYPGFKNHLVKILVSENEKITF